MIVTVEELKQVDALKSIPDEQLPLMAEGIEDFIRRYTNNNFTIKKTAYNTPIKGGKLEMVSSLLKVGDTILIAESNFNNGVYVLQNEDGTLDKDVFDCDNNRVFLVKYPSAVKLGVIKLLSYSAKMDSKQGIASESISRHSVSYQSVSGSDSIGGYPAYLMTFLQPFTKARF